MNRVAINGRFLTQGVTGVQRYAIQMVRALDHRLAADETLRRRYEFRLLTPRSARADLCFANIPAVPVGRLRGQLWEQLELPWHTRHQLLLNLCNTAPLATKGIATIHDASVFVVPTAYSPPFRAWYRALLPRLGTRSLKVVTVSQFSRQELSRRAGIPVSRIEVVYPGADHVLQVPADLSIFGRVPAAPGKYLLAVGSRSPHKNVDAVVKAMSRLGAGRPRLVTAGSANSRIFRDPGEPGDQDVYPAGYVTDGELRALYENAIGLVYPSRYEGFGLPPLEAMACGCPAVVARAASLPEACGDAVLYCDPADPADIARSIDLLLSPARRADLRIRGLQRARHFTWDQAAQALLTILDRLPWA